MTTNRQRIIKLRSRIALLSCRVHIVDEAARGDAAKAVADWERSNIAPLQAEIAELERIIAERRERFSQYLAEYSDNRVEIRRCKRLIQLLRRYPDADPLVLRYRAAHES